MIKLSSNAILNDTELMGINLIDKFLEDQKSLSAADRFSQSHKGMTAPAQQPYYRDLIPIRKPSTGEQYSFAVDMDKCTGCKSCVVACHSRNGLDEKESWRDVGKIVSPSTNELQTITSACHHCLEPSCMSGCPVGAYEKSPSTGVVKHLDDQCIGCEYCSLMCPYDVPKYNKDLGIVRKCDMCHERLAEGEAPACVQACPNGAIKIELVETRDLYARAEKKDSMIPGSFRSNHTFPTTIFRSSRVFPGDMEAVDKKSLEASHKHTPLSWMLMLTQASVGVLLVDIICRVFLPIFGSILSIPLLITSFVLGIMGLLFSVFHLGSPWGAWRVFLGLKTSWLSREVVFFGIWMPLLFAYLLLSVFQFKQEFLSFLNIKVDPNLVLVLGVLALIFGFISVFCSIMVYVDTQRDFWTFPKTGMKFFGTMFLAGSVVLLLVSNVFLPSTSQWIWLFAAIFICLKIGVELYSLVPAFAKSWSTHKKSALIQLVTLKKTLSVRYLSLGGGIFFALFSGNHEIFAFLSIVGFLLGEWFERQIFFQASVTLKMPANLNRC